MMRRVATAIFFVIGVLPGVSALAAELRFSAKTDSLGEPFVAYGYNPATKLISGHLRTAPGRTDECKLVFAGNAEKVNGLAVEVLPSERLPDAPRKAPDASVVMENGEPFLKLSKRSLDGDCDWVLPFNVGPRVLDTTDSLLISMTAPIRGPWTGVYVIRVKRAHFHDRPDSTAVRKAFLVAGDIVYVYRENPDWYFVEYEGDKKKTTGWIKKTDVVRP